MSPDLPLTHVSLEPETELEGLAPAVILIHGRGADEQDLLPVAAELPEELHVLSVRAPDRLMGGYTWYELDLSAGGLHRSQPHPEEFRRSLDLLSDFVEAAVDEYDLDPERIALLGFSQGAIMSLASLLERPDRYRFVVALNGYLAESHQNPELIEGAAGKPVFVGYGTDDQIIPAQRAERAVEALREGGVDVEAREYQAGHGTVPQEIRDVAAWMTDHI